MLAANFSRHGIERRVDRKMLLPDLIQAIEYFWHVAYGTGVPPQAGLLIQEAANQIRPFPYKLEGLHVPTIRTHGDQIEFPRSS